MEPLIVRSARDSWELRLGPPDSVEGGVTYLAELRSPPVSASVEVYDLETSGFISFMASLAKEWRGWKGKKSWGSLEGHINLECQCDAVGHVCTPGRARDGVRGTWCGVVARYIQV